ncbi:MAG TPA: hypothetical protein VFC98_00885 [Clostridia bacterium]|nr:hypothetical protein [Clostridia bacterium]
MIEIKTLFNGWTKVDRREAKRYVEYLKSRITGITASEKDNYINRNRLRGITVAELEEEDEDD